MKSGEYTPERGDIIWLDFNPQAGREQRGKRPALVLSPKIYNQKTSLCVVLPVTSKVKGYPFEVVLPEKLQINGVILSDQIKSLDFHKREATFICKLPKTVLEEVQNNVTALING